MSIVVGISEMLVLAQPEMLNHQRRVKGRLKHEAEELFEEIFWYRINDESLAELNDDLIFWEFMKVADPSTAKRIIAHCLELCSSREEKLPTRLAQAAISLLVKPSARNRIHKRDQMIKAAAFQARHPLASLREIAKAADVNHTLVRQWQQQITYKAELINQLVHYTKRVYAKYVTRFGSPFAAVGLPEPGALGLLRLSAKIKKALAQDTPITDLNILNDALKLPTWSVMLNKSSFDQQ
jgi:hypothetical protein